MNLFRQLRLQNDHILCPADLHSLTHQPGSILINTVKLRFQGIVTGVQRKGYSGQTVNTTGLAIIMDLNEVIGLAVFLEVPDRRALPITLILICFSPLFPRCKHLGLFTRNDKLTLCIHGLL